LRLIAGLGNPGPRYADTRHNVGFWVLERLAERHDIPLRRRARGALYGEGAVAGERVTLALPQTFMNASGHAVASYVAYLDLPLEDLIVVYDDVDLELGRIRLRKKGSAGGHRGLRSVIHCLGDPNFPRLRLGIGPVPPRWDTADFVLSPFGPDERPVIDEAVIGAMGAVESWLVEGIDATMNDYNAV
jgi:PTH1 family peptidyl-tRNA hydrolase